VPRAPAAEALGRIGAPAVDPLIATFKDWDMRDAAAEALGQMGAPALEPLIGALKRGDRDVRQYAAVALGRIGDGMAAVPLIAALNDRGMLVREAAAGALVRSAPRRWPSSRPQDENVREAATEVLVAIGVSAVEPSSRPSKTRMCARLPPRSW